MKILTSIKGIPLLERNNTTIKALHNDMLGSYSISIQTINIFKDDPERAGEVNPLPEGYYISGITLIGGGWLCPGYVGFLLRQYGLILESVDQYRITDTNGSAQRGLVKLEFTHLYFTANIDSIESNYLMVTEEEKL